MPYLDPKRGKFREGTGGGDTRQGAQVADPAELTAKQVSAAPAKEDFNKLLADVTAVRTQLVALLGSLRGAGLIKSS